MCFFEGRRIYPGDSVETDKKAPDYFEKVKKTKTTPKTKEDTLKDE